MITPARKWRFPTMPVAPPGELTPQESGGQAHWRASSPSRRVRKMTLRVLAATVVALAGCNRKADAPETAPSSASEAARPSSSTAQRAAATPAAPSAAPAGPPAAAPTSAPVVGSVDVAAGSGAKPVIHGDKWKDNDEGGGRNFAAFKETWVYVGRRANGAVLFGGLPPARPTGR